MKRKIPLQISSQTLQVGLLWISPQSSEYIVRSFNESRYDIKFEAFEKERKEKVARFMPNPEKNWGPKKKANPQENSNE